QQRQRPGYDPAGCFGDERHSREHRCKQQPPLIAKAGGLLAMRVAVALVRPVAVIVPHALLLAGHYTIDRAGQIVRQRLWLPRANKPSPPDRLCLGPIPTHPAGFKCHPACAKVCARSPRPFAAAAKWAAATIPWLRSSWLRPPPRSSSALPPSPAAPHWRV